MLASSTCKSLFASETKVKEFIVQVSAFLYTSDSRTFKEASGPVPVLCILHFWNETIGMINISYSNPTRHIFVIQVLTPYLKEIITASGQNPRTKSVRRRTLTNCSQKRHTLKLIYSDIGTVFV